MYPTARRLQLVQWEEGTTREDGFREFLIGRGLAPDTTVRNYLLRWRQADEWCVEHNTSLDTITASELAEMMRGIPRTQYTRIGQLRATLSYYWQMTERDRPPIDAIRLPPQPHYPNRALHPDDARMLAKTASGRYPEGLAVSFGLFMGLRVAEIASVNTGRFNHDRTTYTVTGKRSETYTLPVHPRIREDLRLAPDGWVFPGSAGRDHVGNNTVWNWTRKLAAEAGVGKIGCHELRHTCLTQLYRQTRDIYLVQRMGRHKDPKQTAHYVMQDFGSMASAVELMGYE